MIESRPIAVLIMEDEGGTDPKILSIPIRDPRFDGISDIKDVHPHKLKEIQEFFETYKRLEPHKFVKFREWTDAQRAQKIIRYGIDLFAKKKSS